MQLIDTIEVRSQSGIHRIELLLGDLADIPEEHRVDVLVVSAFPNDYSATPTSLIGTLDRRGLEVRGLAHDCPPSLDLRIQFSCWLSREITPAIPGLSFKRLLCFEPATRGAPPALVGDIFRALAPFVYGDPGVRSLALPVLAAGDQGYSISTMLPPILDAATHWMAIGLPLDVIKLVVRSEGDIFKAKLIFKEYQGLPGVKVSDRAGPVERDQNGVDEFPYAVFVSYSRKDEEAARYFADQLNCHGLKVFFDRTDINIGASWQQKIFDALETCKMTAALYSPEYVLSKVCKEEFNISWARSRDADQQMIFPIMLRDASLPTYMRMLNYIDCRISDRSKLASAADVLASRISGN